jgi:hypothetical protein
VEELTDFVWNSLPPFRRALAGRARVDKLVKAAVKHFPAAELYGSKPDIAKQWEKKIRTEEVGFGPIFWIVVSALIQAALTKIIEWWFSKSSHRVLISGWSRELRS